MNPATVSRGSLALLLMAVLVGGVVLGSAVTAFSRDLRATPTPSPTPMPTVTTTLLPDSDVEGVELERLPRYPGSVRTEYEISLDDRYRLTAVEYLADATVEQVRAFYQAVIDDHGWDLADVNYAAGEWTYVLVDDRVEALVEIEEWNGLIEIDLQMSEPVLAPSRQPSPSPSDDDDDDDDGDDGDDDDDDDDHDDDTRDDDGDEGTDG